MEEDGEEGQGGSSDCSSASQHSTGSAGSGGSLLEEGGAGDQVVVVGPEEVEKMSALKLNQVIPAADEPQWRQTIRDQMESELERRVREALATPPRERLTRRRQLAKQRSMSRVDLNAHLLLGLSDKEQNRLKSDHWRALQADKEAIMTYFPASSNAQVEFIFRDELSKSNQDQFPGVFGLESFSEGIKNIREDYTNAVNRYGAKPKTRHFYTKEGFLKALRSGTLPPGVTVLAESGRYVDKYGVERSGDGPFWPVECVPLFPAPRFRCWGGVATEPLYTHLPQSSRTVDNQTTPYNGRWRGTLIVYDSERSPREYNPQPVSEGCCPSLLFESRFESGNLRQARRIGMFEYELVLKTDLYTNRHTQWFFFLVRNVQPGVTYKFKIVNLLKTDSLYNYGMRPLMYSEKDAASKELGWVRTGHHISYTKNVSNTSCPLLSRCVHYYMLEWQMEFSNADDTYYLAHCYPYTFTDLKEDLDTVLTCPDRKACVRREVLCESRAGNSCFLLTVTNFERETKKKAVVVTARVHPGESQASWMMKGLLEFLTGPDPEAQELRDKFVFKLVPMLNPDGVIVGNYRCSLAARDLNRNYRHPRRENFPTIYHLKAKVEALANNYEIMLYCDLHGHSRKHNVFMYGNNTSSDDDTSGVGAARAFISERLFPWLMASTCPDKFSFRSCKFQIRKCKESTGRVVMWRQMNIYNSFTLEATFSGTILDKQNCRHFNIQDLMDVGKGLARAVLEYQHMQENKMKQTEAVLELTRAITQQILESRGLIEPNSELPEFVVNKELMETEAEAVQEDAEKWTEAMLALLQQSSSSSAPDLQPADLDLRGGGQGPRKEEKARVKGAGSVVPGLSRDEANKLLDRASLSTMDGCLNVLAALNVREALQDSDSSDSDSESEPEMKAPDPKPRKKKRKSRKQRDRELHDKKQAGSDKRSDDKDKDGRCKTFSALPALLGCETTPTHSQGHAHSADSVPLDSSSLLTSAHLAKRQAGSVADRLNKDRKSQFQSKYEGRHNGGVPCFTEERSIERAAKRVAEMKKKFEDDKQREVSFVCMEEPTLYSYPSQMYPQVLNQEDLNHRLQVALSEGTANLSRTLMGMNVRTGYTHADNLQDLHPTINGNYLLAAKLSSTSTSPLHHPHHHPHPASSFTSPAGPYTTGNTPSNGSPSLGHVTANFPSPAAPSGGAAAAVSRQLQAAGEIIGQDNSTSEDSDSGGSEILKSQSAALPMAARRSPYYQDLLLQRSPTLTSWSLRATVLSNGQQQQQQQAAASGHGHGHGHGQSVSAGLLPSPSVAKRPVRYKTSQGQMQRILRRHSSQVTPPIMTSSIQPISRDPPRHYDNQVSSMATGSVSSQSSLAPERPQYERARIGRGPLIRGLRQPGIRQGYMWE
ncbi:uncharacterized protein LOC143290869 isoform X2 [Babylonia areolata]|uniref:uncharacterized protein LOC143290869 isoform X2 n=1 Tax=Babylonia areolata TaxID=304850 RepID=UPI003FCF5DC9